GGSGTGGGGDGAEGNNGSVILGRSGGQGGGGAGLGGAIFVNGGASLTLNNVVYNNNSVIGGTGANNGQGLGGNIYYKDKYAAIGNNTDSQFFQLPQPLAGNNITVTGGLGCDIFQLRSYDGLTTSQRVSGGQGSDIFNISIEGSSGRVGLDFNTGKLKQLAELLVTPDWDVREERRTADVGAALIGAGIDYAAAVAGVFANLDPTGIAGGLIDVYATTLHLTNDLTNIQANYNLDMKEYQNNLAGIGKFFDGQGANGWGTVNIQQSRSLVEILDFEPGIDTITLPKLDTTKGEKYTFTLAGDGTNKVLVGFFNQTTGTGTTIPFLSISIASNLQNLVNGQSVGLAEFFQRLLVANSANSVIGKTLNNTSKVAVSGSSYTGTIAGDYIYVAQNNPTVGTVKIYGLAGDDMLAGRKTGKNEIYGGDGNDFIVPGGVNDDIIDGGTGYDQVNYSQNTLGISITSSNSTNFKNVESVTGTGYNDTINFSDLQVAPEDAIPINLEGRAGNDSLVGSKYQDVIDGEYGNDTLTGGEGSDILQGGAGQDTLSGGIGDDVLYGDFKPLELNSTPSYYNGSTYFLTATGTWEQAQAEAKNLGGNLVTINSQNEQNWLFTTFGAEQRWIGFTDKETEQQFKWISGETSSYTNWNPGEPNNVWGNEDYAEILSNGKWNDNTGSYTQRGIIEIKTNNYGDTLTGGTGKDTLTGGLGVDRFNYCTLADSVFNTFDVITDFNATAGNDLFVVSTARTGFSNAGTVAKLDTAGISAKLINTTFTANSAAQFSLGSRTFVAINDATAGFDSAKDAIIEVTGLTGTLGLNNFTIALA
ncbi:MAG: Poly(beta-D-mannuronate) epimerase 7, partial [Cyanobacteriota bacterium]